MTTTDVFKTILATLILAVITVGICAVLPTLAVLALTGEFTERKFETLFEAYITLHAYGLLITLCALPIMRYLAPGLRAYGRVVALCFVINPLYWTIILITRVPPQIDGRLLDIDPDVMSVVTTVITTGLAGVCGLLFLPLLRLLHARNVN